MRPHLASDAPRLSAACGLSEAGRGSGGNPREYAALYLHGNDNRVHLVHGRVPVQRVFFNLHESQALVIFWRGTALSPFDRSEAFLLRDSVEALSPEIGGDTATLVGSISEPANIADPCRPNPTWYAEKLQIPGLMERRSIRGLGKRDLGKSPVGAGIPPPPQISTARMGSDFQGSEASTLTTSDKKIRFSLYKGYTRDTWVWIC